MRSDLYDGKVWKMVDVEQSVVAFPLNDLTTVRAPVSKPIWWERENNRNHYYKSEK